MRYAEVHVQLLAAIPELRTPFEQESRLLQDIEGTRQYLVIELVLNPVLGDLLDANRDFNMLGRVFEFLERMATSSDPEVVNLLGVGVFERMLNKPTRIRVAWHYMGAESRMLARRIARGLLRERSLPDE